jgi:protein TonB
MDLVKFINDVARKYAEDESTREILILNSLTTITELVDKFDKIFRCLVKVSRPKKDGKITMERVELLWKEREFYNSSNLNENVYILNDFLDCMGEIEQDVIEEEIEIPITEQPEEVTPPPPPPQEQVVEELTIVENDAEVEETTIASTEELGQQVEIKYVAPVEEEEEPEENVIFEVVEEQPEFPNGGMSGLMQYLSKNIKYPPIAQENGTQGRVIVQFVVNRDGSIVDAKVMRGVDPYLDKEALRVIAGMPKWKPGKQQGKAVRCRFTVPVMFRLQ